MTITIHSIEGPNIMGEAEYAWITDNLGKKLPLADINTDEDGNINHLVIHDTLHGGVICLFNENGAKFTLHVRDLERRHSVYD